ncbi:MAG: hypothetical protein ACRETL_00960, partial [Gammaproteobacteria bacterium]
MPDVTLQTIGAKLRRTTLKIVWEQWYALGGSVTATQYPQTIVDPEALILASMLLIDEERRLADVMES